MSLGDFLKGIGIGWTWVLPTGAEKDECAWPGCGVARAEHGKDRGHRFTEPGP